MNIVELTRHCVIAALVALPAGCMDLPVDADVEARQGGGSGVDLDIGADGPPGFMLEDVPLRPGMRISYSWGDPRPVTRDSQVPIMRR